MRYKVVTILNDLKAAEEIRKLLEDSKVYQGSKYIMELKPIKEVCDECAKKD